MSFQGHINNTVPVSLTASELNIPGLYLLHDFVSCKEEEVKNTFVLIQYLILVSHLSLEFVDST